MHELSIASSVVDSVLEFLDAHEVKKVLKCTSGHRRVESCRSGAIAFLLRGDHPGNRHGEFNARNRKCRRQWWSARAVPIVGAQNIGKTRSLPHRYRRLSAPIVKAPWNRWKETTVRLRLSNVLPDSDCSAKAPKITRNFSLRLRDI